MENTKDIRKSGPGDRIPGGSGSAGKAGLPGDKSDLGSLVDNKFFDSIVLSEHPYLNALRTGVMMMVPLLLAAAIFILINNFPLQSYQNFMAASFGPGWKAAGVLVHTCTIQVLSLAVSYSLSTTLIQMNNARYPDENEIAPAMGAILSFTCFLIMADPVVTDQGTLEIRWAGIQGMLSAVIMTFLACGIFIRLCRMRRLKIFFYGEHSDPLLPSLFDALLPALGTILFFLLLRFGFNLLGIESLYQLIYDALKVSFKDAQDSFGLGAVYTFLVQICWFFGIHGANLLDPLTHEIFAQGMAANSLALNANEAPPHVVTKYLFDVFIYMGGSGGTLGLIIAIFLRSRDSGSRRIASLSFIPGVFNINELMIFGLPIAFNPLYLIPFVLVPLLLLTTTYLAVVSGLVPPPIYNVDWTTPPIIGGLLSTGSWKGGALQAVNLVIATVIYMPFVSLANARRVRDRQKAFLDLIRYAEDKSLDPRGKRLIYRSGEAGSLARALANDLRLALDRPGEVFLLHFQPRVDLLEKRVTCAEALLRWTHPGYGQVPPLLTLALADDTNLRPQLDNHIIHQALKQQKQWRNEGIDVLVSINISEGQLQDRHFPKFLQEQLTRLELPPSCIQLEAHEDLALDPGGKYFDALRAIHATGVLLGVDEFGKSYRMITQLKKLPISNLQISQILIHDIATNAVGQDVIGSIQELSMSMGLKTSAEYVETQEQLDMLLELNFSTFQGYLFARSMPSEECASFIRNFRGKFKG